MSFSNKIVLILLVCVLIAYFLLLGITVYGNRMATAAAPETPAEPAPGVTEEVAEAEPEEPPPAAWSSAPLLTETISQWKRAQSALERASSQRDRGQLDQAADILEKALEQTPNHREIQLALAGIYREQKQLEQAAEMYWRILASQPNHETARLELARLMAALRNHEAVLEISQWILERDIYLEEPNHLAAQASMALGRPEMAVPFLRRLVALSHNNVVARNNLAVAYSRLGQYNQAIALFKEVLQADRSNSIAYYNLAVCYAQQKNAELAVETLSDAADAFGTSFIGAWVQSRDFDPIRDTVEFRTLERRISGPDQEAAAVSDGRS